MRNWLCASCLHRGTGAPCADCDPDDPVRSDYQSLLTRRGTGYRDVCVRCPFFRRLAARQKMIVCEGPFEDTAQTTYFRRRAELDGHVAAFCESDWERCRIARILTGEKYGG